ncbi:hypothetical protein V3C99_015245 [Haemonchus contortus]|uniref:Neuropeptide-Like Protein n=1 Tax=Haemonchus contortus TaxID=6289 RepID=A0A7I4YVH2_HAECO
MSRFFAFFCFLIVIAFISAVPLYDSVGPQTHDRYKRQFGFGMPFGGYGGAYGDSYGFSESESFNAYNTGFNTGFFGR